MVVQNNKILIILLLVVIFIYCQLINITESFKTLQRRIRGYGGLNGNNYTPWTISNQDQDIVKMIVSQIVNKINAETEASYQLGKFDGVVKTTDNNGNTRYLVDIFLYEVRKYVNRRVIIDFTLLAGTSDVQVNTINLSNALPYPEPEQLHLEIPEKIIRDTNLEKSYQVMGKISSKINYSKYDNPVPKKIDEPSITTQWILPLGIQDTPQRVFPCRKQGNWWNHDAVKNTEEKSAICRGINSACKDRSSIGNFHPPQLKLLSDPNEYSWMFDKSKGIMGLPAGSSNKTGY